MHIQSLLLLLLPLAQAAPTPRSSSSVPLRGNPDLAGYSSSRNVPVKNTTVQYKLAPSQKDKADIGQYLDFEKVNNPQPIRATSGGTDPGPRMFCFFPEWYY